MGGISVHRINSRLAGWAAVGIAVSVVLSGCAGGGGSTGSGKNAGTGIISGVSRGLQGYPNDMVVIRAVRTGSGFYQAFPMSAQPTEVQPLKGGNGLFSLTVPAGTYTLWAVTTYEGVEYYDGGASAPASTAGTLVNVKVLPNQTTTLPAALVAPEVYQAEYCTVNGDFSQSSPYLYDSGQTAQWAFWNLAEVTANTTELWSRLGSGVLNEKVTVQAGWMTDGTTQYDILLGTRGPSVDYTTGGANRLDPSCPYDLHKLLPTPGAGDMTSRVAVLATGKGAAGTGTPETAIYVDETQVWVMQAPGKDVISYTVLSW
jgi:hypothetical protein